MFATVKHRTYKSKGCGSRETYLMMVFKLTQQAQGHWQRINAPNLVKAVAVTFVNGVAVNATNVGHAVKDAQTNDTEKNPSNEKNAA